ncbi:hypothetical protein IU11_07325 [Cellulosimicrobium sp. MM]|nr:hypothetical protein IU11_07325 [Cellulosimicrobium sp. MM]
MTHVFCGAAETLPSRSTMTSMHTCSPGLARSSTDVLSKFSLNGVSSIGSILRHQKESSSSALSES